MNISSKILIKTIELVSMPLWFVSWIKRHKTIKLILLATIAISWLIISLAGLEAFLAALMMVGRLAFVVVFIVIQFVAMFAFLGSSKSIETVPGDKGQKKFEDDYFGNDNEVELVLHWTKLLTLERSKLTEMGAQAISGILMVGPPGVGKTLMARCLAEASNAAFFSLSATDLVSMFMGMGAIKVMRLGSKARAKAKEYGAAIVFIDEIDAIGASRGAVMGDNRFGGTIETTINKMMMGGMSGGGAGMGVLSRLLTVMDGVTEISKRDEIQNRIRTWFGIPTIEQGVVLFIGATNRPDVLDSALVRPGRFDRRISIGLPDKHTRRALFEGYLKKVKHTPMNVDELVADTSGVSHAFIASAIEKDAARLAIFDERKEITQRDIERAIEENIVGMANPIKDMMPEQRRQVAVHEAGHALLMRLVRPSKRIAGASIIRRSGGILGYVRDVEKDEIFARPLSDYTADIMVSLAGHEAVRLVLGEEWTGATYDFRAVQSRLRGLAIHGYFADGMIPFDVDNPFEHKEIKESADRFAHKCRLKTQELLKTHRATLDLLTNALLEKSELTSAELEILLSGITSRRGIEIL